MSEWNSSGDWNDPARPAPERESARQAAAPAPAATDSRVLEKLVGALTAEQRRSRRWGIFFKVLTFVYLFALLFLLRGPLIGGLDGDKAATHTAVVEVAGAIASDTHASADNLVGALRRAFEAENARAVVLRINSPGGSPVQAGYVYDEIVRLREENPDKKVYAVISDIGASGAYYIAAAADEIYANRASLVGSIGVVSGGFGFTGLMDKAGVERRLYTAGENKAFLDPFSPEEPGEVAFWESVLENTHDQFIEYVRKGRGDRLADDERLFSGLVWTGEQALELGLVDGLGSTSWVARELVGAEDIVDYTPQPSAFRQFTDALGVSIVSALRTQMVESRYDLR
ncbi:S49 family peptidase [Marinobacter bryozoorum]|uniref:S49 family peptidase n=1 Tax=Marinobacter bryozoorum TaxID=256324 RepID=UPI0020034E93|nr:S49 family peptidase [Marinobacter bryozoorum]MCK7543219.1 S49 family peptidase [Marinobacter bryozoorum]